MNFVTAMNDYILARKDLGHHKGRWSLLRVPDRAGLVLECDQCRAVIPVVLSASVIVGAIESLACLCDDEYLSLPLEAVLG